METRPTLLLLLLSPAKSSSINQHNKTYAVLFILANLSFRVQEANTENGA